MLRYVIPWVHGRGAGLGNELIPWARAFLMAQVVGGRSLPPAFGLNPRRYWRHFGTPRYDWITHRLLVRTFPVIEFAQSDYEENGAGDVVDAFRAFAEGSKLLDRPRYVVVTKECGAVSITSRRLAPS